MVPESEAYMNLVAFEQNLDSTISRKKLDIQEALKRPMKVKRRLRIYVSHTFYSAKDGGSLEVGLVSPTRSSFAVPPPRPACRLLVE